MADRLIQTGTLTAIADAIRAKTGSSATLTPVQMVNAISGITGGKVTRTWHQCPQVVRDYLTNVDYTNVAYTESSISQYAPTPTNPANTKPVSTTVDGMTFYNEEPNKETPFATANSAGTLKPLDHVRWIHSQTVNMRDLGGWSCDGGTVKYGLLYRSGEVMTQDYDLLINQLGINTECDLTADGTPAFPDKMRFIGHTSYAMYSLSNTGAWITNLTGIFDAVKYGDPVIFHCSMGADRTGTLACVLEGLLGMSQSDIDKDYELTSFYALRARNGNYQGGTADWSHLIGQINAYSGSTFRDKVVSFVLSLGFTVSDINTYRHAMIDGNPEDIVAPTYNVTNALTGCTTSNASTTVEVNGSYSATVTASTGYKMDGATVSITMGGTDITSSAYSNGTITIASVTGNLVIQITAVELPSYTNQIPISTDANGNIFNTTGYKEGYRLNSSGAETALSGYAVTGFMPFTLGQQIIFDKFSGSETSNGGLCFYDANHTVLGYVRVSRLISDGVLTAGQILDYTPPSSIHDGGSGTEKSIANAAYLRISVQSSSPASLSCGIIGEVEPTVYTVANSLTNCSTSNASTSINSGQSYTATITANSGYTLTGASVSVTMGGTDITSTAYSNGTISIPSVSGNISITVSAVSDAPTNLFDPNDADVVLRGRFNSSGAAVSYADNQLVTGYIPASVGDTFVVETDKSLKTNTYTGMVECLTSSKTYISTTIPQGASAAWTFSNEDKTGVCIIPASWSGHDYSGTAYVRFCVAYTDISNIRIYKQ